MASLTLHLFGPMEVLVDGEPLPRIRSRKAKWLLALLALRGGQLVGREWVASVLWPDADKAIALANMRPVVSEIRRALGEQSIRIQTPDRKTILLDLQDAEIDVVTFDVAMRAGRFEEAVAAYRGVLLEDCPEEWVPQERKAREQACLHALHTLGQNNLGAGDFSEAIAHFQRAVVLAPYQDSPRRDLMDAFAQSGDLNAALQVYREFAQAVRSESGGSPDEKTTDLYVRLRSEPAARGQASSGSGVRPTGYLPHPLTALVGRDDERIDIADRLRRHRLVTLTGFGGIGKTRLAGQVAADVAGQFADGVWFVGLDPVSEEREVVQKVAAVLELSGTPGRPLVNVLTEGLKHRRALLVLDNCEQVSETASRLCDVLLRECRDLRILATSREPLGLTGEKVWSTTPLSVPNPAHLPDHPATLLRVVECFESVRLFVERAQAAEDGFQLTAENARTIAGICARLEGIPLALELAAARVGTMTIHQIGQGLRNPLDFLSGEGRFGTVRQQTLRSTIDWSYRLLDDDARRMLSRVAWFVDGWSLNSATEICGGDGIEKGRVLPLLASLVRKSLVSFTPEAGGRYRMLETVRQYASADSSAEGEFLKERFVDSFCVRAEEAVAGATHKTGLDWLRAEEGNLLQAMRWADEIPELSSWSLRLATAWGQYGFAIGRFHEGFLRLQTRLTEDAGEPTRARAQALSIASQLGYAEGCYSQALQFQEAALEIYRELGDKSGIAQSARAMGDAYDGIGKSQTAQVFYEESLRLRKEIGDDRGAAIVSVLRGRCLSTKGDVESAIRSISEGLEFFGSTSEALGVAWSQNTMGNAYLDNCMPEAALPYYERALQLEEENGPQRSPYTMDNLAKAIADLGDCERALSLLEEALGLARSLDDRRCTLGLLRSAGEVALAQGDFDAAIRSTRECLELMNGEDAPFDAIYAFCTLGGAHLGLGNVREGIHLLAAARGLRERLELDVANVDLLRQETFERGAESLLDPSDYAEAWNCGYSLSMKDAFMIATGQSDSGS